MNLCYLSPSTTGLVPIRLIVPPCLRAQVKENLNTLSPLTLQDAFEKQNRDDAPNSKTDNTSYVVNDSSDAISTNLRSKQWLYLWGWKSDSKDEPPFP